MDEIICEDLENDFIFSVLNKFSRHSHDNDKQTTFTNLMRYLIRCNIIKDITVSKYMVMQYYPESLYENNNKTEALDEIAQKTGFTRKHVYNMVQHPERFSYRIKQKGKNKNTIL